MYYKIVNKKSDVFIKLEAMRKLENEIEEENKQSITEKVGLEWEEYLGYAGQQSFNRVTKYSGFSFKHPEKVDTKIWKRHKDYNDIFIPNKRTWLGKEMAQFLNNGLKGHSYSNVFRILNVPQPYGRHKFPWIEVVGEVIIMFLGDEVQPTDENIIEITHKEFEGIWK